MYFCILNVLKKGCTKYYGNKYVFKRYHNIPFIDLYQRTLGEPLSDKLFIRLKTKHPGIENLSHDHLQCTVQILKKFGISAYDVCSTTENAHVFVMNPITMDNYGEILRECGFVNILPKHIIRYHTLVRSRTVDGIKKEGLIREELNLEQQLLSCFKEWPDEEKTLENFPDSSTCILTIRMSVLQKYLAWRLAVTSEEFSKYCKNYLPLKHKPLGDIQEALDIAQNDINFDVKTIKRNGFIISSDPVNTKLIIENVRNLAGYEIREAIKIEPAILKNNYIALLRIRNILEEYRIPLEAQRRCLKVYCMCPNTVKERLDELRHLKEYQILKTNPRVLSMIVHKRKMINRLEKIQAAKKQCFSLNHLVSSSKVFNNYISSFGNKICGRDMAVLISSSLQLMRSNNASSEKELLKHIQGLMKKHKFWLHSELHVINENIKFLKKTFDDDVILKNCHLLLYPLSEIEMYIHTLTEMRRGDITIKNSRDLSLDTNYNSLNFRTLNDNQILSLVLYEIEKKYHFSGDGIWARPDGAKIDSRNSR